MKKDITTLEDLLTDEEFLAAYDGRNGDRKEQWRQWVDWMKADPVRADLITQAIRLLTVIRLAEAPIPLRQTETAARNLLQRIARTEEQRRWPPARPLLLLRNYLTVAIRNLTREIAFSAINILGLALGLAVCLLITLYVRDELSYDRFNVNADRIYRLQADISYNGNHTDGIGTPPPMGPILVKDFPEIRQYTRIGGLFSGLVKKGAVTVEESDFVMTDSTIFDIFTLPFITGDPHTALVHPNNIVIAEDVALKYFGTVNCLGQTLHINNEKDCIVTGVMKDMPEQSHFHARFLVPLSQNPDCWSSNLLDNSFITYVLVRPGITEAGLNHCLDLFTRDHIMPAITNFLHGNMDHLFENPDNHYRFYSMPVTNIHLSSNLKYIYIFTTIAVLILLMACINFMNLSTARSAHRAKEVGIRKVLGSLRKELVAQFLTESLLTSFLAMLIGIALAVALLHYLNLLSGKHLTIGFLTNRWLLSWLTATILVVGLLAGLYPAFYLSAFRPVQVLRGKLIIGFRSGWLRNVLVVFQFTIAILLIVGTGVIYRQLDYIRHKDLGYNREQVLVINNISSLWIHAQHFKQEVSQMPGVLGATMTFCLPNEAGTGSNTYFKDRSMTSSQAVILTPWPIDADYVPTLGMTMVMGRNFSPNLPADSTGILINETAQRLMGYDNPIGQSIYQPVDAALAPDQARAYHIIGVIKDFQPGSLHDKIPPMIFQMDEVRGALAVRVKTDDMPALISRIEKAYFSWDKMRGQPFPWYFMDEAFNNLYRDDQRTGVLFITFAGLAILIGCLGLFGLVTYAAEQRTREIGIRKVLGASPASIVRLLSREFLILTGISALIAFPLGTWAMRTWLETFAYHTTISWWIFAAAGTLAIGITLLTVSFRTIDAARTDPAKTLRHAS
jgi:putative ABC transport system permease protein